MVERGDKPKYLYLRPTELLNRLAYGEQRRIIDDKGNTESTLNNPQSLTRQGVVLQTMLSELQEAGILMLDSCIF